MSDEYDQKLRDMQKYVPFLENLIQNLKKSNKHDEKREAQLNKMQMFYELLTNKNKKLKLETLERCEQVLVKLYQKAEKIKSELPLSTESGPAKFLTTPVISTPEKLNDHTYVPQNSVTNMPLLPKPTPTTTSVASCSVSKNAINTSNSPEKSNCSVSYLSTLQATPEKCIPNVEETEKSNREKEENEEEAECQNDESIHQNEEMVHEEVVDNSVVQKAEAIHLETTKVLEPIQPTDVLESCHQIVNNENSTSILNKVFVDASTADNVEPISPDTNEQTEQTDIPSNVTDDWKSAKRKNDDYSSIPLTNDSETAIESCELQKEASDSDMDIDEDIHRPVEPEPACSSMEIEDEEEVDNDQSTETDDRRDEPPKTSEHSQRKSVDTADTLPKTETTVTSTMKNDPEECSVTSTTATDPRREKATECESDEQNSLQDTVTDSSSNNEGSAKNWIPGALLNLLNPNTIDKSTVLNMLEKVVEGEKFQQIKAILAAEENKKNSAENEKKVKDETDEEKPIITTKVENVKEEKIENGVDEIDNALALSDDKKFDMKPHNRVRRTELDRLNEDVKFILDTETEQIGPTTKRACTENKTPNYCEIGPEAPLKAPPVEPVEVVAPPPKKKKKKKYEVFSYRTRRRSKRKKPTIPTIAALADTESVADGTESSLGGGDIGEAADDSLLEEGPDPVDEPTDDPTEEPALDEIDEKDAYQPPTHVRDTKEEMTEDEKAFKNIHPEMHSLSKFVSTCAICKFSGRYVTTHYMNSHRMTEMVTSRLPPKAQDRLMKGQGMDSLFTGKDPFQNRVYQFTCPFCNVKKNYARKIWSQHFGSHTGEYKYKCSGCGYMSVNVRGHIMKYCHGSKPIMLENLDRGQDIVGFICKLCNYIQMNREHVIAHIENQHEISEGCSELISEITLFRSDLKNLYNNSKKLKVVETVSTPTPSSSKQVPSASQTSNEAVADDAEESDKDEEPDNADEQTDTLTTTQIGRKFQIPKPPEGETLKNIYPYIHSQSEYVMRCVLCSYAGKFITKHYVKEHPDDEVFVARIPPERQAKLLNNQQLTKIGPITVVKYKNYYRHSACPFCPVEKSSQRFDWVMHFAIHTGEYKFRCTQCNHYGNARNEFARHFKIGCPQGKLVRLWSCYKYNEEDPIIGYFCKLCNYIQLSRKNVQRHLETQHGNTVLNGIQQITLFCGNPRYKGRRSVKGGKKGKKSKRKIKHTSDSGVVSVPDFLCEGVVDEEFMAEEGGMIEESQKQLREQRKPVDDDDDLVLPMHQISDDFIDAGFEHLFQMEMSETGDAAAIATNTEPDAETSLELPQTAELENTDKSNENQELIRPDEDPPQNIHPEMHAQSPYASKCLLCDFGGKYIAKHYIEEHPDHEIFSSRLPPEAQRSLLSGERSQPIKCVIRSRKMNYYFSCPFCKLERDCTRHNWIAHFAIHTGEYKYKCSQCSHVGNATRDFKRHFKGNCRFAKQERQWPDLVSKEEPIMAFYCNLCNYIQLDRGRVIDHLKTQHSCYEQLISKVMLLFIDPKTQMETAINATGTPAVTAAAAVKRKFLNRRLGKLRKKRPISRMWSASSQKRAWLNRHPQAGDEEPDNDEDEEAGEEEEDEEGVDGSDDEFDDAEVDQLAEGGAAEKDTEDVIEIDDSDEEKPPAKDTSSTLNSYEKIKRFIEQSEIKVKTKVAIKLTHPIPTIKREDRSLPPLKPAPSLPCSAPTKDRPLSNIHPEMHSLSLYSKKCILCPFVGRHLINHYISFHPRFEVPISRLPPESQKLLVANKANFAIEVETNPFSPKLFTYTCLFCDTEFTFTIKSWVDHIGTHTGEYNFKCSQCSRMINTKHDILEHIKQYCKKGKALARQFPVTEKQQLLAHFCKLCNFIQMNRGNIVQHLRIQHKVQSTTEQITQITLLQFGKHPVPSTKIDSKILVPKKEDRIKVENTKYDTKYTTKEYVKVDQSDAIYEILVPETELKVPSENTTPSATIKTERTNDNDTVPLMRTRNLTRQSMPGGSGEQASNPRQTVTAITLRRSVPGMNTQSSSSQQSTTPPATPGLDSVKRVSNLGYSYTRDGTTKYHCCIRSCTFNPTTVPISLATHIMDDHSTLFWEGYCRECQGHVATGKNMKLTKEIQHLFEHTRKRPAPTDMTDSKAGILLVAPPPKLQRRTDLGPQRPGLTVRKAGSNEDSPDQIMARFANNKSITITREVKANEAGTSILPPLTPIPTQNAAVSKQQQQVLKEVKRTALKPWTVSKSVKTENTIQSLLSDISLFAFFKCMGNDCQYTTNDSNKMAEHLTLHSERADKEKKSEQPTESNVFSWLECCYCSTWAGTVMQLIAHITAKHSRDIYQCPYCFYRSCEEYNVGVHIKHYHRQQQLSIMFCFGRRLLKPGGDLAIHTVKKMKCLTCPINFMNPIAFATHVAEYTDLDLGGDIYKCYYCSKKHTKSIIEFARHIVEHRPVRKADSYKCYKCFKMQTQNNILPNKNNIKAYQCVHCAYSTDDEFQIGLHMAQVHASNLLFCGLRIRTNTFNPTVQPDDINNRVDNGAAFVLLKKRVDEKLLYRCPYTPTQLNYLDTTLPQENVNQNEDEDVDMKETREGSCASPVITQNPGFLQIAQVQSITNTEFASFITIDDDDDD